MERSFCLLVFFCLKIIGADFIFSAHIASVNYVLTYQDFFISPTMKAYEPDKKKTYICTINEKRLKNQSEYNYLLSFKGKLLDCFFEQNTKVYDTSIVNMLKASTNTQLYIMPIRFRALFDDDKCRIYILNKDK